MLRRLIRIQKRVARVGLEVKHGRRRAGGCVGSIWPLQFGSPRDIEQAEAKTTKDQTIRKHTDPAFVEPMQCKPVTTLSMDEKLSFNSPAKNKG
jgi:hypothetical protein